MSIYSRSTQGGVAVIDLADALTTDLDVLQVIGTGKHEIAPGGFLLAIDQVGATCPLAQIF